MTGTVLLRLKSGQLRTKLIRFENFVIFMISVFILIRRGWGAYSDCLPLERDLAYLRGGASGLSKVAGCQQKLPPTRLVLADYSAWHFFTYDVF